MGRAGKLYHRVARFEPCEQCRCAAVTAAFVARLATDDLNHALVVY